MKPTHLCLLSLLMTTAPVSSSWAFFGKKEKNYLNANENSQVSTEATKALGLLQEEMIVKFNDIETEIASGNTQRALSLAKSVLDTVKVKTGIDPKNKIQEKFYVATKFPADVKSIYDLSDDQRELVIKTISQYRAGLYLDIMNLSKRTTLLYIKALQAELVRSGGITNEDKEKIINDLVKASLIPMPVEDKSNGSIVVFDEDVANEDHTYLFNRELKMFLLQEKSLDVSEESFQKRRNQLKESLGGKRSRSGNGYTEGLSCMANASNMFYSNDIAEAKVKCFNEYSEGVKTQVECDALASELYYRDHIASAKKTCFYRFNKFSN